MKIGKTTIKKKINFGKHEVDVTIEAYEGRAGNIFYVCADNGNVFNTFTSLQYNYWSALKEMTEEHFLALCVRVLGNKMEVLVI